MNAIRGHFEDMSFGVVLSPNDDELVKLIEDQGGTCATWVCQDATHPYPSLLGDIANQILIGEIDVLILGSSASVRRFLGLASRQVDRQRLVDSLNDITVVAGSSATASAFAEYQIVPKLIIDRMPMWRDILVKLDAECDLGNCKVVQDGSFNVFELRAGLEARGAEVLSAELFPISEDFDHEAAITFLDRTSSGEFDILVFSCPDVVPHFFKIVQQTRSDFSNFEPLQVFAIGQETASLLADRRIRVTRNSSDSNFQQAITLLIGSMTEIQREQDRVNSTLSGPSSSSGDHSAPWYDNPFMKACRGEQVDVTPVWMMRQAGRYMAEYRDVRAKVSFLELCANPQLCSEVMCTAVQRLGVDAAIIFSDLLPVLVPMGMDLEFVKGDGPVIHNPIRVAGDVDRVKPLESNDALHFVMDTVKQTRNDLPADMPLIGFAGAPFTLASYMIEGGSSRNYATTKQLMRSDPSAWDQLMQHLVASLKIYLNGQVESGAQVIQLFDSWAGCLGFDDYRNFVLPYVQQVIASLPGDVPVINFATGNPTLLPLLADTPAKVIGVDWRIRLDAAWDIVGSDRSVQGNLDPTVLLTDVETIKTEVKTILGQAANRPGHIFNLGHGILPQTPVDNAIALVDIVHELSQR